MKLGIAACLLAATATTVVHYASAQNPELTTGNMVKMCLFYEGPTGHARSDPIISNDCVSDHIHTFYGPQQFHPQTSYNDLISADPAMSRSPFVENQSLYWHPTVYRVSPNGPDSQTYTRIPVGMVSPYYRWDNSVFPRTEAFPPGFRMIAFTDDLRADLAGESEANLIIECECGWQPCERQDGGCTPGPGNDFFPVESCPCFAIAFAFPTCWDGVELGSGNDHRDHMAYTLDGSVAGDCPTGFPHRLPQVQLFIRFEDYQGGWHEFSNEQTNFHLDFMNGWQEGKLQEIIDNCEPTGEFGYNPECNCDQFLTPVDTLPGKVCPEDVKTHVINEEVDVLNVLPRGLCSGNENLIPRTWADGQSPPFVTTCAEGVDLDEEDDGSDGQDGDDMDGMDGEDLDGDDMDGEDGEEDPEGEDFHGDIFEGDHPEDEEDEFFDGEEDGEDGDGSDGEGEGAEETDPFQCTDKVLAFSDDTQKNCAWVGQDPETRCDMMWEDKELWELCPMACDADCEDCCWSDWIVCDQATEEICIGVYDNCVDACLAENENVQACLEDVCVAAEDDCFAAREEECQGGWEACLDVCL